LDGTIAEIEEFFSGDFIQWTKGFSFFTYFVIFIFCFLCYFPILLFFFTFLVVERKFKSASVLATKGELTAYYTKLNLSSFSTSVQDIDFVSVNFVFFVFVFLFSLHKQLI
jgi:hypothetical protein